MKKNIFISIVFSATLVASGFAFAGEACDWWWWDLGIVCHTPK
ncbi:hypothetical protein QWY82_11350 [Simiduia curdlanivorans]|uniref:Uncharacterized protein n=1 Tax=Simiduia curdlanivorans TaxID=1492769 RepID=A0ABV8VA02_9GAMM|nr:hypothetical protein [Simiduia curdlanivorans]MDN3639401.1 hypothetical protein [Simiduia curdlanivorans]